jgi:FkbM family methyltransferase
VVLARKHAPYTLDVADHFDYYHGAVEAETVDGIALVDYSQPREHRLRPSGDSFLFTGFAEPEETTDVYLEHARLTGGDLVLDLGAYCGASTVSFAKAVGVAGHVVAFEPDSENAAALRENVRRHGLTNVTIVEAGIWRTSTELAFSAEGNMGSALAAVLPRATHTRTVRVLSLDDAAQLACATADIGRVAFVKMDIEGAEIAALEAAGDFLATHRPRLAIEPHRTEAGADLAALNTDELIHLLGEAGQSCELAMQGVGAHPLVLAAPEASST